MSSLGIFDKETKTYKKVADLSKLVDKTLLVSRQNNRSFVDSFEIKQDK